FAAAAICAEGVLRDILLIDEPQCVVSARRRREGPILLFVSCQEVEQRSRRTIDLDIVHVEMDRPKFRLLAPQVIDTFCFGNERNDDPEEILALENHIMNEAEL